AITPAPVATAEAKPQPPPIPVIPEPPPRPAQRAVGAITPPATTPAAGGEQVRNSHLESQRAKTGAGPRRRKKKSETAAIVAWILVGAITFTGMAFLMRPQLFARILTHPPQAVSQNIDAASNAPEPAKELEAKNLSPVTKPTAPASANVME